MKSHEGQYTLGLDIGIASVGWGLIDEDQNIIDAGVRLFPEADVNNNEGRRGFRGARRLLRRRRHRLERIKRLLTNYEIISDESDLDYSEIATPYHVRVKGLTTELTKNELAIALIHLGKRRGIHNVEAVEETKGNEGSTKEQLSENAAALKDRFVCELQLERLEEDGEVRGHQNRFKTDDYVREAEKLLETQSNYHSEIDDEFVKTYIELLSNRREYWEGPGQGSEYGWEEDVNKWYEQMMGRCSYYPDELRAVKESYSAQLFNALNELNNLTISREENDRLTKVEKESLIKNVYKKYKNPTLKQIAKNLGVDEHDIRGYRVNSKQNPIFTPLTIYHDLKGVTDKEDILEDPQVLDEIAEIVSINQTPSDVKKQLVEQLDLPLKEKELDELSQLNYTGTHSLSLKVIHQMLPDLWATNDNQMQLFSKYGLAPKEIDLSGRKYLPYNHIDDWILSPVVKRAFKQSIRIVNEVMKQYGEPKEIVVELARESSSDDQKAFYRKLQKDNQEINRQVEEKLATAGREKKKGIFNKLRLWHLQDGLCMYSLQPIPIDDLLDHHEKYEIDHIIPRSVSFDDSQKNKVLVKTDENQKKGNQTPHQYLKSGKGQITYDKFKTHILQMAKNHQKMPKKKKEYLLEERDINKFDLQKEFINRNLVDTRYATRELLTLLTSFFKENDRQVHVKSINGAFTDFLRKQWRFPKDRGADFKHHAEDALIVGMAGYLFDHNKRLKKHNVVMTETKAADAKTGEVIDDSDFLESFNNRMNKVKAIKEYDKYKYSHKVDMKPNRQLMNDTLYSTREYDGDEYVIEKITNLYDKDQTKLVDKLKKKPEKLLMYHHDPQTYKSLIQVMDQYSEAKNPLHKYYEEKGEYVRKYSRKGNGPPVKSVKFYGDKLKTHKDVSHKFNSENKKVVNLSIKPFRMDVYWDDGKYKFVTVRYNDLKDVGNRYQIDEENYNTLLENKKINSVDNFLFSMFTNDICSLNNERFRLVGVNDDDKNKIELNTVNFEYKDYCDRNDIKGNRIYKYIGNKTESFYKITTDVLGNEYVNQEKLKFEYPKG
ncbi:type II CRISPR RNA-guided endonuclease Cas9 [Alkalibacillus sp. S2W]|uniref:type II CRISPR RNA-guided endonuclease Cas9 n=1 Tax=Alkalibacillus sp. S2W TaxID=3386553 RepID=UPI00398D24B8